MVDRIFDMIGDMIEGHREEMIRQMDEVHDTPLFRRSHATMPYYTQVQYTTVSAIGANHHRQSAPISADTALCYPKPIEISPLENLKR
jgi:hypothetical protein